MIENNNQKIKIKMIRLYVTENDRLENNVCLNVTECT